ncbi:MAG: phosphate transporter, partial [Gammaproteobacteria bacterium]|nr:phosphate transporter [Gammaproteobacteria bacterium]
RSVADGVHWPQLWKVLEALALSPVLGFVLAACLYLLCRKTLRDEHLYRPVSDKPPIWWMRGVLILTCSGVSLSHGMNDGQKSIGLIMLTIIGLFPAAYALNPTANLSVHDLAAVTRDAEPLVLKYGDDEKEAALDAVRSIDAMKPDAPLAPSAGRLDLEVGLHSRAAKQRSNLRDDIYRIISELKHAEETAGVSADEKRKAQQLGKRLASWVEYAPLWVRLMSALCLGIGTMIGYRRIVTTLGERLGNVHLTPAQGAAAEVVSSILIGTAGFTGLPVSTTHIVASGIGGTMVAAGAGLRYRMVSRIVIAWVFTLPATIIIAGGLYYVLASPNF